MKRFEASLGIALLLSMPAVASAAEGKEGGKSSGISSAPGGPVGGSPGGRPDTRDTSLETPGQTKWWELEADWEFHHLFVQNDLAGGAAVPGSPDTGVAENKNLNYFAAIARFFATRNDVFSFRAGLYQRFIADENETGVRGDDLIFSYTHYFNLPLGWQIRALNWWTAPTSFDSRLAGIITVPRLMVGVDKTFVKYLTFDARVYGDYYIVHYAEAAGGQPNPRGDLNLAVGLVLSMPFHPPLQLGGSLFTGYEWFYQVGTPPVSEVAQYGATTDARFPSQPPEQLYGGEIYLRYLLPSLYGFKTDLLVAVANGDPTLGYASALHDGSRYLYGLYRQNGEVYGALTARY